jgi:hypothetical protein
MWRANPFTYLEDTPVDGKATCWACASQITNSVSLDLCKNVGSLSRRYAVIKPTADRGEIRCYLYSCRLNPIVDKGGNVKQRECERCCQPI